MFTGCFDLSPALRRPLIVAWTLLCSPLLFIPIFGGVGSRVRRMRLGAGVAHYWARGVLRILGVRISANGPAPPHGAFFASNHTSWLDILVLAAWSPTNFIAKKEVAQIPLIGFFAGYAGTLFLNRESRRDAHRMAQELRQLLAGGLCITLFPEGFCADGQKLMPFRASLFGAAAELGTPCVPISIHYNLAAVVWNDGSSAAEHCKLMLQARQAQLNGAPIVATLHSAAALSNPDRKQLARRIESTVHSMYQPYVPSTQEQAHS